MHFGQTQILPPPPHIGPTLISYSNSITSVPQYLHPTYRDNVTVARKGGGVAKVAREQLEQQLGRSVISDSNSSTLRISGDSPDEQ